MPRSSREPPWGHRAYLHSDDRATRKKLLLQRSTEFLQPLRSMSSLM